MTKQAAAAIPEAIAPEKYAADIATFQRYVDAVTKQRNEALNRMAGMEADAVEMRIALEERDNTIAVLKKQIEAMIPPPQKPNEAEA